VQVFIQLFRTSDQATSEPKEFIYKPNSGHNSAKRKRVDESFIPTVIEKFQATKPSDYSKSSFSASNATSMSNVFENHQQQQHNHQHSQSISLSSFDQNHAIPHEEIESEIKLWIKILDECDIPSDMATMTDTQLVEYCSKLTTDSDTDELNVEGQFLSDINYTTIDKLKLISSFYADKFSVEKVRELMMILIRDAEEKKDENVLIDAIQYGRLQHVKELLMIIFKYKLHDIIANVNETDQNVLHICILSGYKNLLKIFISLGANVNQADAFGITPLHLAVKQNSLLMIQELLKESSLKLNELDDNGQTALSMATLNANFQIVKELVEAGSNVTKQNPLNGYTCLHVAIRNENIKMVKYFIEINHSLLYVECNEGMNAMKLAIVNKSSDEIVQFLLSHYDNAEDETDVKKDDAKNDFLDEQCLQELSEIFNENHQWKTWVTRMEITDSKIDEWMKLDSPSRAIFDHLIVS
jgi:ankyrin repeat protein